MDFDKNEDDFLSSDHSIPDTEKLSQKMFIFQNPQSLNSVKDNENFIKKGAGIIDNKKFEKHESNCEESSDVFGSNKFFDSQNISSKKALTNLNTNSRSCLSAPDPKFTRKTGKIRGSTFKAGFSDRKPQSPKKSQGAFESLSKKRMSKFNAKKSIKDLHQVLYLKKQIKKFSLMTPSLGMKKINKYHLNLIGDLTCNIINKNGLNYKQKFKNMLTSLSDEISGKYEYYDEMLQSASPVRRGKTLKNRSKLKKKISNLKKKIERKSKKLIFNIKRIGKIIKVIPPDSIWKFMIDIFNLGVTLFCIFFIPLHNIFWVHQGINSDLIMILIIVQLILLLFGLNVGFISNGIVFTQRKLIFKRFLSLETLSDIIYLILLLMTWQENDNFEVNYLKSSQHLFLSSVMLFLLIFKFFKLKQLINYFVEYLLNLSTTSTMILSLSQLCFFLIVCAHILSCQWILITKFDSENGNYTWLEKFGLAQSEWKEIYLYGFYWAVVTMMTVGYGDILPLTYLEHFFVIIAMMIACCIFAYIMNTIGSILEELNNQQAYLRKQQNMVNHFLKEKKIDNKLQMKIKKHLVNVWNLKKENKIDTNALIEKVPETFREDVMVQIYGKYIKQNKILKKTFSNKLLEKISTSAKEKVYIPDDLIITENSPDNCAYYYIYKGKVDLFYGDNYVIKFLCTGEWFGELAFFSGRPRQASAKSMEYTSIFYLTRSSCLQILQNFNYDYEKFCYIKDRINIYENYVDMQLGCLSCRSYNHLTKNCNYITFKKKLPVDLLREEIHEHNSTYIRKKRPKVNALASHEIIEEKSEEFYQDNFILFELESPQLQSGTGKIIEPQFRKNSVFNSILEDFDKNKDQNNIKLDLSNSSIGDESENMLEMIECRTSSLKSTTSLKKKNQSNQSMELKLKEFEKYEFMLQFETMKNYQLYFPHNNAHYVIKKIRAKDRDVSSF